MKDLKIFNSEYTESQSNSFITKQMPDFLSKIHNIIRILNSVLVREAVARGYDEGFVGIFYKKKKKRNIRAEINGDRRLIGLYNLESACRSRVFIRHTTSSIGRWVPQGLVDFLIWRR